MDHSTVGKNGKIAEHLPLSVMLFHNAMERNLTLSSFARELGISPLSLRQFIEGNTQRPRSKTLEAIAGVLKISVEEARRRLNLPPETGPGFAEWLQAQMNGGRLSRAKLTRDTRISDGALRNYLSGQTLPDSDQARRLADTLGVPTIDVARLIVGHRTAQAGGVTVAPPAPLAAPTLEVEPPAAMSSAHAPVVEPVAAPLNRDEEQLLMLWRQLHPQARRATLIYIAGLLAERG